MVDESGYELKDYKFWCFKGKVKFIQVICGRNKGNFNSNYFNKDWETVEIRRKSHPPIDPNLLICPNRLEEMIYIAENLSQDIPFVRVDLYHTPDRIYFGELTFFPVGGFVDFSNKDDDSLLGSWIDMSLVEKNQKKDNNVKK